MPDVELEAVCIDATAGDANQEAVARFWGVALGQVVERCDDDDHHLAAPEAGPASRQVWINGVPESPAGKSRVHIDIRLTGGDPEPLVAAGGRVVGEATSETPWTIVEDPDGVAVCVMAAHPAAPDELGPFELNVDAADPEAIATWWAERTGGTVGRRPGTDFVWVEGAASFPYRFWVFASVPEPKAVKNRVHWDVRLVDATIGDLVEAGATLVRPPDDEIGWTIMADPEGNEFCVFDRA